MGRIGDFYRQALTAGRIGDFYRQAGWIGDFYPPFYPRQALSGQDW
jgi:hypothetical protein